LYETYFSIPVFLLEGACTPADLDTQDCLDSDQAETQLSFNLLNRADAPQIRFADANGFLVDETLSASVEYPLKLANSDVSTYVASVASPPFVSDSDEVAPAPAFDASTGGAQLTFATEDRVQPRLHITAQVRLQAGTSLPAGVPSVSYWNVQLEETRSTELSQGRAVGYRLLLSVEGAPRDGSGGVTRLHCSPECPSGLEILI